MITPAEQKIVETAVKKLDAHQESTFGTTLELGRAMIDAKRVLKRKFTKWMEEKRPKSSRSINYAMAMERVYGTVPPLMIKDVPLHLLRRLSSKKLTRLREEILGQVTPLVADEVAVRIKEATYKEPPTAGEVVKTALEVMRTKGEFVADFDGTWSDDMLATAEALRLLVSLFPRQIRNALRTSQPAAHKPAPAPHATTKRKPEPQS